MRAEGRALSLILIGLPELVSWAEHDRVQSRVKAGLPGLLCTSNTRLPDLVNRWPRHDVYLAT